MAKCLRCGAGSEWLEGKVPTSTRFVDELTEERDRYRAALEDIARNYKGQNVMEDSLMVSVTHGVAQRALKDES